MFQQVNIVTADMERSIAFYDLLGATVPSAPVEWPEGSGRLHAEASMPNGTSVEFDNAASAAAWAPHWSARRGVVVGFTVASPEDVDATFERVVGAGFAAIEPPYDAFWGARYAVVEDPDGNAVGIMGPMPQR